MAALDQFQGSRQDTFHSTSAARLSRWWLWFSVPIATLAIGGSLAGIFVDRIYANETTEWAGQAVGQDIANLVVFPALLVFAYAAARGSLKAHLAWTGTLVYSAYTYTIYAFDVHFGPLFLLDVAVFGLSVWALGASLASTDPTPVKERFAAAHLVDFAAYLLIGVSGGFALLWLSEDVPAIIGGSASDALTESGLLTNPVHVLDLSLFLPACMLAGLLLRRGRAWGYYLAPVLLTAMASIGIGIVVLMVVLDARGEDSSLTLAALIGGLVVVQAVTAWRFLQGIATDTSLVADLRNGAFSPPNPPARPKSWRERCARCSPRAVIAIRLVRNSRRSSRRESGDDVRTSG
jgi:hypothetical protein